MTAVVEPLPLDKVDAVTYYGVKVSGVGEENEIAVFTHDRRRALAAVARFVREQWAGHVARVWVRDATWWQVFDHAECGSGCPFESWVGVECAEDTPGAVPVLKVEVDYR